MARKKAQIAPKINEAEAEQIAEILHLCVEDWRIFARVVLGCDLDKEQEEILLSVQHNKMTSVASGTARGKDFVTAVACICFLYLTPRYGLNEKGEYVMIENTKVAMTAPTDRQVGNIMFPEISRLFHRMRSNGFHLPGRLTGYDIRTDNEEWFLTGFKAGDDHHEAWSGFHAANTMFAVTEASGISETTFNAIEGNLQGNSRMLIVFNPNVSVGYAARSQKSPRWHKFRLDSLTAPNVLLKKQVIPGQVDYEWVADKVREWCEPISEKEYLEAEGDFYFELDGHKRAYRPNDLFRIKVRGMFPKVSEDTLIPLEWIEIANKRWKEVTENNSIKDDPNRLGVDVAGMGRDSTVFIPRYKNYVHRIEKIHSGGRANHMEVAGKTYSFLQKYPWCNAFIDTIGEGAGVYSRLDELKMKRAYSVKFSHSPEHNGTMLKDATGVYEFLNMRAYLYWALRDWLNPRLNPYACLPPDDELTQELTEIKWQFLSNGRIKIEPKEDIQARLKRSPDKADALALTFYPVKDIDPSRKKDSAVSKYFF